MIFTDGKETVRAWPINQENMEMGILRNQLRAMDDVMVHEETVTIYPNTKRMQLGGYGEWLILGQDGFFFMGHNKFRIKYVYYLNWSFDELSRNADISHG
jgi:hypothetical protein